MKVQSKLQINNLKTKTKCSIQIANEENQKFHPIKNMH